MMESQRIEDSGASSVKDPHRPTSRLYRPRRHTSTPSDARRLLVLQQLLFHLCQVK